MFDYLLYMFYLYNLGMPLLVYLPLRYRSYPSFHYYSLFLQLLLLLLRLCMFLLVYLQIGRAHV